MEVEENKALELEKTDAAAVDEYGPYESKPLFVMTNSDMAFALSAVLLSAFTAVCGVFGGFALGYTLSSVLWIGVLLIYFAKHSRTSASAIVYGVLAVANSAVFVSTTNVSVRFFGTVVGLALALACFGTLINGSTKGNRCTVGMFFEAVSTTTNTAATVKSLFANKDGGKKTLGKVLIGLICAVPVLLVILPLLMSSDDAFRGMMNNLFSNTLTTIMKAIPGVVVSVFVISYGFSLKAKRTATMPTGNFAGIESVYVISFLSAIAVCYVLYLFSQLAYFFSAFRGFLPAGEITYAQYARKGFFEMCIIAVINLAIVFAALLISKKREGKVCHAIKAIATFISGFTLIIIATALSKMVLYIDTYGMTVLRLTTSAFMLFLGVVFISVILRIYSTKINIVKTALITAGCVVLVLGTVNVNAVCAQYNYESYINGRLDSIDVHALYNLGDEGIPYVIKLAEGEDAELSVTAQRYLADAYTCVYFEKLPETFTVEGLKRSRKKNGFEGFAIPQAAAYEELYRFAEDYPEFGEICASLCEAEDAMLF